MRVLGIDPGGKRLGIAVGDDLTGVVTPDSILAYEGVTRAAAAISEAVARHAADLVILGLPTNADGDETAACVRSHKLASALEVLGLRVVLQSEYLSSNEAHRRARARGRSSGEPVDDLAACVILEDYLATRSTADITS